MKKEKRETNSKKRQIIRSSKEKPAKKIQAKKTQDTMIKTTQVTEKRNNYFPIVGMCASAGGLEAFEQFFKNMPSDSGMAFILVLHLDPTHKSIMVELIKRCTDMEVVEARDGLQVQPNSIYIIPPNNDLAILHGGLQLIEPAAPRGQRLPIDYFLRALAKDRRERAICIILSGTGSDGTAGLKAIKGEGGMVMVQDPANAKYGGMPRSAIETNLVDYILPTDKMPEQLISYAKRTGAHALKNDKDVAKRLPDSLQKIFILLRSHTGHDFSLYKMNTIIRRIERRMSAHKIDKMSDYIRYMQEHRSEIDLLFKELIIGVTNFFRDKEAFEVLKTKICPHLLRGKSSDDSIRIWVVGCSTGEEAYSIVMSLREYMGDKALETKVQLFATDIDEDAIELARAGLYPESISVDVSPERLKRFFVKEGKAYRISKNIREMIVFAPQNVIKDPPFSKLDMISCRNLLIYLDTELQKKILPLFHYILKPEGMLFLGSSETIGSFVDLFSVSDKKWKFFKRKEHALSAYPLMDFPTVVRPEMNNEIRQIGTGNKQPVLKLSNQVEQILLDNYAPPCVIINQKCEILYVNGRTGKYLEPASGEARMNILDMAREGLKSNLQLGIRKCISGNSDIVIKKVQIKGNGSFQLINLSIKPVHSPVHNDNLMMVLFEDLKQTEDVEKTRSKFEGDRDYKKRLTGLEQELKHSRENLNTTIEELETSNEELKSINEELQSTNEEFQSTNEELETSKEELQSLNEELVTVNSELVTKIDEATQSSNDMKNLLDSTHIGMVFLGNDLKIRRFNNETPKVINLISSDIGRPIMHISTNLADENLIEDIKGVIKSLVFVEKEVQTVSGSWYLMRIMPYRTTDNVIDGVVITFVNIDEQKKATHDAHDARILAEGVIDTVRVPLLVLDSALRVMSANRSFYAKFQVKPGETEKTLVYEMGNGQWNVPRLRELLEEIIPRQTVISDFEVKHEFERIGLRAMLLNARRIDFADGRDKLILLVIQDVTERTPVGGD